jgi:hypothetical protein
VDLSTIVLLCTIAQGLAALDYLVGRHLPMLKIPFGKFPSWVLAALIILCTVLNVSLYLQNRVRDTNLPAAGETVTGRFFKNEVVLLDGKTFANCTFENATLPSVITSKPAIHDHFKTGQRSCTQNMKLLYLADARSGKFCSVSF